MPFANPSPASGPDPGFFLVESASEIRLKSKVVCIAVQCTDSQKN